MSKLRRLIDDLQETDGLVSRLNAAMSASPDDEILRINTESVQKRRDDLVRRLDQTLHNQQHDFVGYNIMRQVTSYPAIAVADSVRAFQELVTCIFDALRGTPKPQYRPSAENVALSTLDFVGAREGSVAVSLHIPNERMMVVESDMDMTFGRLFQLLSSRQQAEFRDLVPKIGVSSITRAYRWASVSAQFGLDTSVQWGRSLRDLKRISISHDDALKMKAAIEETSDENEDDFEYDCILEGIDPGEQYFHLITTDGTNIKGETSDVFPRTEWTVSRPYRALLVCKTTVKFATGQIDEKWTLKALIPK